LSLSAFCLFVALELIAPPIRALASKPVNSKPRAAISAWILTWLEAVQGALIQSFATRLRRDRIGKRSQDCGQAVALISAATGFPSRGAYRVRVQCIWARVDFDACGGSLGSAVGDPARTESGVDGCGACCLRRGISTRILSRDVSGTAWVVHTIDICSESIERLGGSLLRSPPGVAPLSSLIPRRLRLLRRDRRNEGRHNDRDSAYAVRARCVIAANDISALAQAATILYEQKAVPFICAIESALQPTRCRPIAADCDIGAAPMVWRRSAWIA